VCSTGVKHEAIHGSILPAQEIDLVGNLKETYGRTTHYQLAINNQPVGCSYFQPKLEEIPTKVWNVIFSLLQGWHYKVMTHVLI